MQEKTNVEKLVESKLGEGFECIKTDVKKNNGVTLTGYCIRQKDQSLSPTVYPKDFDTDEEIADFIVNAYNNREKFEFDISAITKEYVLERVKPQVVNFAKNDELLSTMLYKGFLDLAVMFRVYINDEASFLISKSTAAYVDVTVDELYDAAMKNAEYECISMEELMLEMISKNMGISVDEIPEAIKDHVRGDEKMFVISNKSKTYGAAALLDNKILVEVASIFGGDFIIIPSSVHELIAIEAKSEKSNDINEMIMSVNSTEVSEEEMLSDHFYYFNAETQEVTI